MTTNIYTRKNLDKAAELVLGGMTADDALRQIAAECAIAEARAAAHKAVKDAVNRARLVAEQLVYAPDALVEGIKADHDRIAAGVKEYQRTHGRGTPVPWAELGLVYRHPAAWRLARAWKREKWSPSGCWMQRVTATPALLEAYGLSADTPLTVRRGETDKA